LPFLPEPFIKQKAGLQQNSEARPPTACSFAAKEERLLSFFDCLRKFGEVSMHDPLTGAANWRLFEEYSNREILRARRSNKPVTLAYVDLDNFEAVNDMLGHDVGDELLQKMCQILFKQARPGDMLARLGGDEFALLMPETDLQGAQVVIKRLNDHICNLMKARQWQVTLSIGVVTFYIHFLRDLRVFARVLSLPLSIHNVLVHAKARRRE
jgi:diguanylate cyclase (GGDEF)-like protein